MDVIHIKLDERNEIDFDVKTDKYFCWSPFTITFAIKRQKREYVHSVKNPKTIKKIMRKIEALREDKFLDLTI